MGMWFPALCSMTLVFGFFFFLDLCLFFGWRFAVLRCGFELQSGISLSCLIFRKTKFLDWFSSSFQYLLPAWELTLSLVIQCLFVLKCEDKSRGVKDFPFRFSLVTLHRRREACSTLCEVSCKYVDRYNRPCGIDSQQSWLVSNVRRQVFYGWPLPGCLCFSALLLKLLLNPTLVSVVSLMSFFGSFLATEP
jgi:hypothetical protein